MLWLRIDINIITHLLTVYKTDTEPLYFNYKAYRLREKREGLLKAVIKFEPTVLSFPVFTHHDTCNT